MGRSGRNSKCNIHSKFTPSGIASSAMDLENSSLFIDEFISLPIFDNSDFSAEYDNENNDTSQSKSNTRPKYIRVYMNSGVMIKSGICAGTPVFVERSENNDEEEKVDSDNEDISSTNKLNQVYIEMLI